MGSLCSSPFARRPFICSKTGGLFLHTNKSTDEFSCHPWEKKNQRNIRVSITSNEWCTMIKEVNRRLIVSPKVRTLRTNENSQNQPRPPEQIQAVQEFIAHMNETIGRERGIFFAFKHEWTMEFLYAIPAELKQTFEEVPAPIPTLHEAITEIRSLTAEMNQLKLELHNLKRSNQQICEPETGSIHLQVEGEPQQTTSPEMMEVALHDA